MDPWNSRNGRSHRQSYTGEKQRSETSRLIGGGVTPITTDSAFKYRFVEPLPVIYSATAAIIEPVIQQYAYLRISEKFGNQRSNSSQTDELSQLCNTNTSSPAFKIQQATQSATSEFLMYLTIVQVLLCCPALLVIGPLIDRMGRKIAIYMTFISRLFFGITIACVIKFELPIEVLYAGVAADGICGTIEVTMMACNTYLADVTLPGNHRAFRMTLLEGVLGLTSGTFSIATGFLIKDTNFLVPMYIVIGLMLVGLIYAIFFLAESYDPDENSLGHPRLDCSILKSSFEPYLHDTSEKRRSRLLLALAGGFFTAPTLTASPDVIVLYVLNLPFCWTSDHIGIFLAAQIFSRWTVALTLVKLLQRFLSDVDIIILGNFSSFLATIIMAFAETDFTIYLSVCAGIFAYVALPNIRSAMSKLVKKEEVGSLFAGFYFIEAVSTLIFEIVYNMVYAATLPIMRGIVFLLISLMLLIAIVIFLIYKSISKKMMHQVKFGIKWTDQSSQSQEN